MKSNNPFLFFDKIFYINLDHREDRKNQIENEFSKYDIKAERWPAIRISKEENDILTAKGYPLCENVSDENPSHKERIINVTLGQRSCLFSHLSVIRYAKENNLKNVLIFEDDAVFNHDVDVIDILSKTLDELENVEWDMFKLGCLLSGFSEKKGDYLCKLSIFSAAHAYAVNNTCYDIILDFPFESEMNIDTRYGSLSGRNIIKAYTPKIPLSFQKESFSDIQLHNVGGLENHILDRYENMMQKVITNSSIGIHGQLGNQMFQYALLLGIKHTKNIKIAFDPEVRKNSYLFDFFDLAECSIQKFNTTNLYQERHFHYDESVFDTNQDTDFRGYFQTDKYFKHCSYIVRKEFTFKQDITDKVNNYLSQYEGKKLIMVHVRRGDYLINPTYHPQPPNEYYYTAMDMLDDGNSVFICISNDKSWCEENIKRDNLVYESNDLVYDLCLMSKCHDYIIANSTFSWWGSWLGISPTKKIISPKVWFGPAAGGIDTKDVYCDDFIKL